MRLAALLALAVLALALALAATPAHARVVLSDEDAAELANQLADAREVQDVCYGWVVEVQDDSGGESGVDFGSDRGPDTQIEGNCTSFVVLEAGILYTSESSESEDSASLTIEDAWSASIGVGDLEALGYKEDDLLGDENDVALMNMVGALPAIAAEKAGVKPVPFETPDVPAGQQGEPTGSPGSDFLRENGALLAIGFLLLALGILWVVLERLGKLRPVLRKAGVPVKRAEAPVRRADTGGTNGPR